MHSLSRKNYLFAILCSLAMISHANLLIQSLNSNQSSQNNSKEVVNSSRNNFANADRKTKCCTQNASHSTVYTGQTKPKISHERHFETECEIPTKAAPVGPAGSKSRKNESVGESTAVIVRSPTKRKSPIQRAPCGSGG